MVHIRRVLIEALKPRESSLVELSKAICTVNGVDECEFVVTDVDAKTETIRLTVKGNDIEYDGLCDEEKITFNNSWNKLIVGDSSLLYGKRDNILAGILSFFNRFSLYL